MADETGRVKFAVLWKNKDRNDREYLSGKPRPENLEEAIDLLRRGGKLFVFANANKREGKRDPDFTVFVNPPRGETG